MTAWLLLVAALLLILACGVFVAAEFAFVTVDRSQVERAAADGDAAARGLQQALRSLSTQLSGAQVGITITTLTMGYIAEPIIAGWFTPLLAAMSVPWAMWPIPAATAEPAPPDEPPGVSDASRGFLVSPWTKLVVNQR